MKKHLLYCLICCFLATICQAQQDKSVTKLDRSIVNLLLDTDSSLRDYKLHNFTLKIEYKDLKISNIQLSDNVDSLFARTYLKRINELNFSELNSYLEEQNLRSAVFIKPIYYLLCRTQCEEAILNLNDLNNSMNFKGKTFVGQNIRLAPHIMILRPMH